MRNRIFAGCLALHFVVPFAVALNLNNNFQPLTVSTSVACAIAYSTTIPNCVVADFQLPNSCSDACVTGLLSIAASVMADCIGLQANDKTLIFKVFNGQVIQSVCPANSVKPSSSSVKKSSTPTSPTVASSSSTFQTPTQASSTTASSSISVAPNLSSVPAAAVSTVSSQATSQTITTTTISTTSNPPKPTTADPNGSRVGLSLKQQQLAALRNSGGGSPFDISGYNEEGGALQQQITGMVWTTITLFWVIMLLCR